MQPLCEACNAKKSNRLSNAQLIDWVCSRGLHHFLWAVWADDNKYLSFYEKMDFNRWIATSKRITEAQHLYRSFLENHGKRASG